MKCHVVVAAAVRPNPHSRRPGRQSEHTVSTTPDASTRPSILETPFFSRRGLILLGVASLSAGAGAAAVGRGISEPTPLAAPLDTRPDGPPDSPDNSPQQEGGPAPATSGPEDTRGAPSANPEMRRFIPLREVAEVLPEPRDIEFAGRVWPDVHVLTPDLLVRGIDFVVPTRATSLHWHGWCGGRTNTRVVLELTAADNRRVVRAPLNSRAAQRTRAAVKSGTGLHLGVTARPDADVMLSGARLEVAP